MIWFIGGVALGILVSFCLVAAGSRYQRWACAFQILELDRTLKAQIEIAAAHNEAMEAMVESLSHAVGALLDTVGEEEELPPFVVPNKERKH
jgi:hypothetical protein